MTPWFIALSVSLILAFTSTRAVISLCRRLLLFATPVPDRWHRAPTPALGGVAIYLAVALPWVVLDLRPPDGSLWLFLFSSAAFVLGLADDLRKLHPLWKLLGQLVCASGFLALAPDFTIFHLALLDATLCLVWLVGITNAFNLLDNVNGLCAGSALLTLTGLVLVKSLLSGAGESLFLLPFIGATLGFLYFNFPRGRIFMGDSGSQFLGFSIAAATLLTLNSSAGSRLSLWLIPVLLLLLPISDTTLVTISRLRSGQSIARGGLDHISHRLVRLGISDSVVVLILWSFALVHTGLALLVIHYGIRQLLPVLIAALSATIAALLCLLRTDRPATPSSLARGTVPTAVPATLPQPASPHPRAFAEGG